MRYDARKAVDRECGYLSDRHGLLGLDGGGHLRGDRGRQETL
jgi:hypothetical protein